MLCACQWLEHSAARYIQAGLAEIDGTAQNGCIHCCLAALVFGAGVVVLDSASFTLSGNSSMTNNTAYYSGGAIHGSGGSRVVVKGGSTLSYNNGQLYGGAIQGDETAVITVEGGSRIYNNTGEACCCIAEAVTAAKVNLQL